jgi:hypothetical protein
MANIQDSYCQNSFHGTQLYFPLTIRVVCMLQQVFADLFWLFICKELSFDFL